MKKPTELGSENPLKQKPALEKRQRQAINSRHPNCPRRAVSSGRKGKQ